MIHFNMQKLVTIVHWFNLLAALFLTATMMFEFVEVPWGLWPQILFFGSYAIEFLLDKKWQEVKWDKTRIYFLMMFLFFALALLYYPFDSTTYFQTLLERRYALAGFAFVGFFGVNDKYKLSYFLNLFVITALLVIAYLLFVGIGVSEFFSSDQKINLFNTTRTTFVNQHMGFNLFLDLALVAIWYLLKTSWRFLPMWQRVTYLLSAAVFLTCLLISEGRAGFLITIVLVYVIVAFEVWQRFSKWGLLVALGLLLLAIPFAYQHQRIHDKRILDDPRVFLWKSAWTVIEEKPLLGHGISRAQERFNVERERNQTAVFAYEVKTKWANIIIDSHNQVTQTGMEFGLLGVCLLFYLWLAPLYMVDKKRRLFTFLIILLYINQSMFNPFITGRSSVFFGIMTLLLLRIPNNLIYPKNSFK